MFALLGALGGGLMRLAPEVFKYFTDKADKRHELDMMDKQLELDKARAKSNLDAAHTQLDSAELNGMVATLQQQMKPTGIRWVDALNATVRPVVTYWWMALFSANKLVLVAAAALELYAAVAVAQSTGDYVSALHTFAHGLWTGKDANILSMILGYWFVDRTFRHNNGV